MRDALKYCSIICRSFTLLSFNESQSARVRVGHDAMRATSLLLQSSIVLFLPVMECFAAVIETCLRCSASSAVRSRQSSGVG